MQLLSSAGIRGEMRLYVYALLSTLVGAALAMATFTGLV